MITLVVDPIRGDIYIYWWVDKADLCETFLIMISGIDPNLIIARYCYHSCHFAKSPYLCCRKLVLRCHYSVFETLSILSNKCGDWWNWIILMFYSQSTWNVCLSIILILYTRWRCWYLNKYISPSKLKYFVFVSKWN